MSPALVCGRTACLWAATIFISIILMHVAARPAAAEDDSPKASSQEIRSVEIAVSAEANTLKDRSITTALTAAPFGGLDASGLRIKFERTGSHYEYNQALLAAPVVTGDDVDRTVSLGYERDEEHLTFAVLLGWDQQNNAISERDPANGTIGRKDGVKGQIEVSYDLDEHVSIEGSGEFSPVNLTWQVDLKALVAINDMLRIGPQVISQGDAHYHQQKAGAFVSGLKLGRVELALGAGAVFDARQGAGTYLDVESQIRF